ncbi:unnamed protein product [Urochloa humidicola]
MDSASQGEEGDGREAPLLSNSSKQEEWQPAPGNCRSLARRVCDESKKLWEIVGPAIFTRTATYSLNVIMQAFAGHLGDLELASVSFACTVLAGFNYGLLVRPFSFIQARKVATYI